MSSMKIHTSCSGIKDAARHLENIVEEKVALEFIEEIKVHAEAIRKENDVLMTVYDDGKSTLITPEIFVEKCQGILKTDTPVFFKLAANIFGVCDELKDRVEDVLFDLETELSQKLKEFEEVKRDFESSNTKKQMLRELLNTWERR